MNQSEGVVFVPGLVTPDLPQIADDQPWMPTAPDLRPAGIPSAMPTPTQGSARKMPVTITRISRRSVKIGISTY
jgi:hypothetical protein